MNVVFREKFLHVTVVKANLDMHIKVGAMSSGITHTLLIIGVTCLEFRNACIRHVYIMYINLHIFY